MNTYITKNSMDRQRVKRRRFPKDFRKVSNYIRDNRGIHVVLSESTEFTGFFDREIRIHHNYDLRKNGLFVLLFEVGKSLQSLSRQTNQFDKETHPQEWNHYQYIIDKEAWETAYELSNMLKIELDWHDFSKFKYNHLLKYFSNKTN